MENQIDIVLKAIDNATGVIKSVQSEIQILSKKAQESSTKIANSNKTAGTSFTALAKGIYTAAAAYGVFSTGKAILTLTSQVEQARIGFTTLLKSEEAALKMLKDIEVFAAKTPFEKVTLIPLVQQLMGMGFEAKQALPIMNVLGDSVAALGKGEESLKSVIAQLGQMRTKNVVLGQDMRILAENGLPVYDILKEKLKLTEDQLRRVGDAGIAASIGIPALLSGLNERFGGAMQKQNQTLLGQWSNLMDNLKAMVGSAGQTLNNQIAGWITTVNNFFDNNRPIIAKFMADILTYVGTTTKAIGQMFGGLGSAVSSILAAVTGDTEKSTASQAQSWSYLALIVSNAIAIIANVIGGVARFAGDAFTFAASIIRGVWNTLAATLAAYILSIGARIEEVVNLGIKAWNIFAEATGKTTVDTITFFSEKSKVAFDVVAKTATGSASDIAGAWTNMTKGMDESTSAMAKNLLENTEQYNRKVKKGGEEQSDLWKRIEKELGNMTDAVNKNGAAHASAKDAAKGQAEEMKKLKATAEDAMKSVLDKLKDEKKEITETQEKIKKLGEEWAKYKQEGVKALSDVNNELQKLRKEASDVTAQSNAERDTKMAERLVDVYKEIEQKKKDIADAQGNSTDMQAIVDMQAELVRLEQERDYIKSSVNEKTIADAQAYADLSQAQKIAFDAEAERQRQLEENTNRQNALIEKRMILEAQANQKSIADLGIVIGMKEGMLTASMLDEQGQRVEIHDAENIALANEVATKQAQYKADADSLTKTLNDKLDAQSGHIAAVTQLYTEFNKYLKKDTADTAKSMMLELNNVTKSLLQVIALRKTAGFGSVQAVVPVDGARADGGRVESGSTYLVGERGPELFVPNTGGSIVPNEAMGGTVNININLGGVQVKSEADMNMLVKKIKEEIARDVQTYKLGIV